MTEQNKNQDVDAFLRKHNFVITKTNYKKPILWENFDTIIFDADDTIWNCFDTNGNKIGALKTKPPYSMGEHGECYDSLGSKIQLKNNFDKRLNKLHSMGKSLYIVSYSENFNVTDEQQPVRLLLKAFGLYDLFDDIIVDKTEPKSEHVEELQYGDTVFIDDDIENLSDVANNTKNVVPFDAKKIKF